MSEREFVGTPNREKRQTKRHRARNGNVRGGGQWHKNAVLRVLRNPVNAGFMPYGDELYEGEQEAIVDRETFDRAQVLLDTKKDCGVKRPGRNPAYLLSGILRCACGGSLTPASTRARGKVYRYYRCVTRDKRGPEACNARPLSADAIEEFVVAWIRGAVASKEILAQVEEALETRIEVLRRPLRKQRRNLRDHLRHKEQEHRRAVDDAANAQGGSRELLEEQASFLAEELAAVQARFQDTRQRLAAVEQAEMDGKWVASMLRDFDRIWDVMSVENRGRLMRALIRTVTVDDAAGTVEVELVDLEANLPESPGDTTPPTPVNPGIEGSHDQIPTP